jgi:YfiH family protein
MYRSELLNQFDWLEHGFGDRHDNSWPAERLATLKQIHSKMVLPAEGPGLAGEGDALVTDRPGLLIGVKTADCVPILLADSRTRAVAAVHAGWRGTSASIAGAALASMSARYGTVAADVYAAIGPCIGVCCYEVGSEVLPHLRPGEKQHLDLAAANLRQLVDAGVPESHISSAGLCTKCNEQFHSYRRDREHAGRMISAVGIKNEGRELPEFAPL